MSETVDQVREIRARVNQLWTEETPATVPWTDYSATSSIQGWSSFTTKQISYKKSGTLVFVHFFLAGPSDNAVTWFSLPYTSVSGLDILQAIPAKDNNIIISNAVAAVNASDYIVRVYKDLAGTGWTTGGVTKQVSGDFFYEAV
jgi:hypothetical protein